MGNLLENPWVDNDGESYVYDSFFDSPATVVLGILSIPTMIVEFLVYNVLGRVAGNIAGFVTFFATIGAGWITFLFTMFDYFNPPMQPTHPPLPPPPPPHPQPDEILQPGPTKRDTPAGGLRKPRFDFTNLTPKPIDAGALRKLRFGFTPIIV